MENTQSAHLIDEIDTLSKWRNRFSKILKYLPFAYRPKTLYLACFQCYVSSCHMLLSIFCSRTYYANAICQTLTRKFFFTFSSNYLISETFENCTYFLYILIRITHCLIVSENLVYGTMNRNFPIIWRDWRAKNQSHLLIDLNPSFMRDWALEIQ